jgi:hypothetical protein
MLPCQGCGKEFKGDFGLSCHLGRSTWCLPSRKRRFEHDEADEESRRDMAADMYSQAADTDSDALPPQQGALSQEQLAAIMSARDDFDTEYDVPCEFYLHQC